MDASSAAGERRRASRACKAASSPCSRSGVGGSLTVSTTATASAAARSRSRRSRARAPTLSRGSGGGAVVDRGDSRPRRSRPCGDSCGGDGASKPGGGDPRRDVERSASGGGDSRRDVGASASACVRSDVVDSVEGRRRRGSSSARGAGAFALPNHDLSTARTATPTANKAHRSEPIDTSASSVPVTRRFTRRPHLFTKRTNCFPTASRGGF